MKKLTAPFLAVLITCAALLLAIWLPKAFFPIGEPYAEETAAIITETPETLLEKGAFVGEVLASRHSFVTEVSSSLKDEEKQAYFKELVTLLEAGKLPGFLYDEVWNVLDEAVTEKVTISSRSGTGLSLIHIYYEWVSDWSNWMEVFIDEETGKILYAYLSGSCRIDGTDYARDYPDTPSLDELSLVYAEYMGYSMGGVVYSENPKENALTFTCGDGIGKGNVFVNLIYYAGNMYDVKIAPQP